MIIPEYWLKRPAFELTTMQRKEFRFLHQKMLENPDIPWIENLPVPKWVFLSWLTEEKDVLLHGSSNPEISLFEPRTSDAKDDDEFSQQTAVFAASEGIWPMFYAILDRENFHPRFLNGAPHFELPTGLSDVRYFFSVTQDVLEKSPWCEGVMYLLPRDGFILQPSHPLGDFIIHELHWANLKTVKPLAKLKVLPEDFPFLGQVRGHDHDTVQARAKANLSGYPWLE
jgi:hypothetical protein